jgi:hypothetical protein
MDDERVLVVISILIVSNVKQTVRLRLVFRYPAEQLQHPMVAMVPQSANE